ncbi:MAG: iron-sulfur cluster biosynthesis family protein [Rhodocyclaceae bacterium]|jgi:iron-sulfur cluster assembly protein
MFTLTPAAASRILDSARESDAEGMALRVAAKIEDDGRLSFGIGFDEEREHDLSYECEGLTVVIAPPSRDLLEGMQLDFAEVEAGNWQFVFLQTGSSGGCPPSNCGGCGSRGGCSSAN